MAFTQRYSNMTIERKRYRFGGITWFILTIVLVAVYYWFYRDLVIFLTVAGIAVVLFVFLWYLSRRGIASKTEIMHGDLTSHQKKVTKGYKQQQNPYNVRFCEDCKHKIEKGSSFCSHCGKVVED